MNQAAFQRISVSQAKEILESQNSSLLDIRDAQSFALEHVPEAQHLDGNNVDAFLQSADKSQPLIIYCYHGNSSQSAAQYFAEQGFEQVYSVDGGFEHWRSQL